MILCGSTITVLEGCKQQETSRLTIVVEGKELSDTQIFIDGKASGQLTQTIVTGEGKIYINGILSAKLPPQGHSEKDTCSGCADSITLEAGERTIMLQKKRVQVFQVVLNIAPGRHLLTVSPDQGMVKLDDKSFKIGPTNMVVVDSQKGR
jgi:hypothetical protein